MTFRITIIGAGTYFFCNQIAGKSEAVKSLIVCAAELARIMFFVGLLACLLK